MRSLGMVLVLTGAILAPGSALSAPPDVTRIAVVVSSNTGLPGEAPLLYTDEDGRRVGAVLTEVGAVSPQDLFVVGDAHLDDLTDALGRAVVRASAIRDAGGVVDLLVYYTGHAGVDGLHLHGETLPLTALKTAARVIPARRRIYAIDACQSGQLFRSKGVTLVDLDGAPRDFDPPSDEAWITSSGPEERALEVEGRRGSLFTHFFVSGARGAADADRDTRVTLPELMSFVGQQTTTAAATLGHIQQPKWAGEFDDFVIGDLSRAEAGLRVSGPVRRALLVIDRQTVEVVAELPAGPGGLLAVPAGSYQLLAMSEGERIEVADVKVDAGSVRQVDLSSELVAVRGVRSKGGLVVRQPWTLATGYSASLGAGPGAAHTDGMWIGLRRMVGHGHTAGLRLSGIGGRGRSDFAEIDDRAVRGAVEWTWDAGWRGVRWGPGARVGGGLLRQVARRRADSPWGAWYGEDSAERVGHIGLVEATALGFLAAPAGPLDVQVTAALGAATWLAETTRVTPLAELELGLGVRF